MAEKREPQPMSAPEPLVVVEDLSVDFRSSGRDTHAVRNVSFDIGKGETVALVGRIRLGQDRDRALDPPPPALPGGVASFGLDPVQGRGPDGAAARRASAMSAATRSR